MSHYVLSAIVATYKSDPVYLRTALDSALGQTLAEVEVVVSDDSPDDSVAAVVASYGDTRISYRRNRPALGVAENHRTAIARARAPRIAILNHDDFWEPQFAEKMVRALDEAPDSVLAFCDHWIVDAGGSRMEEKTEANTRYWRRDALAPGLHKPFFDLFSAGTIPSAMGAVFRKDALAAEIPREAGPAYDLWLTFLLCSSGGGAVYVPERLSNWRTHPHSITTQGSPEWSLGEAKCWKAVLEQEDLGSLHAAARSKAARAYLAAAIVSLRQGDTAEGRELARQALALQPSTKALVTSLLCRLPGRITGSLVRRI